jgi:hypothetical protein
MGFWPYSNIARAGARSGIENVAAQAAVPNVGLADTQGIMQAAQKVAEYSFGQCVLPFENGARADGCLVSYRDLCAFVKRSEVTTGQGNAGGSTHNSSQSKGTGGVNQRGFGTVGETFSFHCFESGQFVP